MIVENGNKATSKCASNLTVLIPMDIVHIEWTIEICSIDKIQ